VIEKVFYLQAGLCYLLIIQFREATALNSPKLKEQIESKLKVYIKRFIRYSSFSHLTAERKEILAGTFVYLKDDHDLIPDDVPNIGYLDDLMVFVEAAKHFISTGAPISGVCNAEEVLEDLQFVQRNAGLMFGDSHFSIETIKKLGQKHSEELTTLAQEIKSKYTDLGDLEND
jgi:uncharacterized membrane protein YkvA (DUF1232 family)